MTRKPKNRPDATPQLRRSGKGVPLPLPRQRGLPGAGNSQERLCWRFTHLDNDGPWGFTNADIVTVCDVLRKLASFETMTVAEVFHRGDEPGKDYDVAALPNPVARNRLEVAGLADQTKIWRIALGGRPRLYGFLVGNIFHVVWWDPEHEVWPSQKKHT